MNESEKHNIIIHVCCRFGLCRAHGKRRRQGNVTYATVATTLVGFPDTWQCDSCLVCFVPPGMGFCCLHDERPTCVVLNRIKLSWKRPDARATFLVSVGPKWSPQPAHAVPVTSVPTVEQSTARSFPTEKQSVYSCNHLVYFSLQTNRETIFHTRITTLRRIADFLLTFPRRVTKPGRSSAS